MAQVRLAGIVLGSTDPARLATFYQQLLDLTRVDDEEDWVRLASGPTARPSLAFQREPDFVPPAWPLVPGEQQMHQHLDIATDDLEGAVARAEGLGATREPHQPQDDVRVMRDPEGHVFCLFAGPELVP